MSCANLKITAAPTILWVLLVVLSPLCFGQAEADKPDALKIAWNSLKAGDEAAPTHALLALKEEPKGAEGNLCISLVLFWKGQFKDAPRYMRRAISAKLSTVLDSTKPSDLMPKADFQIRLTELAKLAENDAEACFLTGALLAMNNDAIRATVFLIRAEELASTDGQAEKLRSPEAETRRFEYSRTALSDGNFGEAATALMMTLFEFPDQPVNRVALAICMAAENQLDMAATLLAGLGELGDPDSLLADVKAIGLPAKQLALVVQALNSKEETLPRLRLATMVAFAIGYYNSAREIALLGLLKDQLDGMCFDIRDYMERENLVGDPDSAAELEPAKPTTLSLAGIQKLLQREEYASALKELLEYTGREPAAYLLVYIAGVGAAQFNAASKSIQHWIVKLNSKQPFTLNLIREQFTKTEVFDDWALGLEVAMRADPDQADLRLLHAFSECTRGNFGQARDDLEIATVSLPANKAIDRLTRYLNKPELETDSMPDTIKSQPSPGVLHVRGIEAFRADKFKEAMEYFTKAAEGDPKLEGITKSLIRGSFALGEFQNAMRYIRELFKEQNVLEEGVTTFSFRMSTGYSSFAKYETHLHALQSAANKAFIGEDEWPLLGCIQFDKRNWLKSRNALQNWRDKTTNKTLSPILLRMLEHAKKKAE